MEGERQKCEDNKWDGKNEEDKVSIFPINKYVVHSANQMARAVCFGLDWSMYYSSTIF